MMRRCCLLPALVFLLVAAQEPEKGKDLKSLEGTWTVVSMESEGKPIPEKVFKGRQMIFKGDQLTIKQGKKILGTGTIKVNFGQVPYSIDYREAKDIYSPYDAGIMQIEGDTMKYCTTAERGKRPDKFDSKLGWLFVLKRDKSK
jgi:uncharacterized protein (TIGR03067 family)